MFGGYDPRLDEHAKHVQATIGALLMLLEEKGVLSKDDMARFTELKTLALAEVDQQVAAKKAEEMAKLEKEKPGLAAFLRLSQSVLDNEGV